MKQVVRPVSKTGHQPHLFITQIDDIVFLSVGQGKYVPHRKTYFKSFKNKIQRDFRFDNLTFNY